MIPVTEHDFAGEFAEARSLLHAANELTRKANKIIRRQINKRLKRWVKQGNHEKIKELAKSLPDGTEKFYVYFAAQEAEIKVKKT